MTSRRSLWTFVAGAMVVALVLGLGLACDGEGDDVATSITAGPETTAPASTTTQAPTTTMPPDVDVSGMLVGLWDCIDLPGDYTIEFRADGTGVTYQEGEIGDIFSEFSYTTDGYMVTLAYEDDMFQTLELSADGSVLTEAPPYGMFSFQRQ